MLVKESVHSQTDPIDSSDAKCSFTNRSNWFQWREVFTHK